MLYMTLRLNVRDDNDEVWSFSSEI